MPALKRRRRLQGGDHAPNDEDLTVGEFLGDWLVSRQSLRPSTRVSYSTHVRRYLTPHLGDLPLVALRPIHIDRMHREITIRAEHPGRPISVATARRIHATLTSALNTAVRQGLMQRNPAATVEFPPVPRTRLETWTGAELARFLAATRPDRLHPLFLLLGLTGLRRGEAVALRWRDVDLNRGLVRVELSAVRVGDVTVVGAPKTSSGARTVAIDDETARR